MTYKLAYKNDGTFEGFYSEDIHQYIPEQHININNELWNVLLSKQYRLKTVVGLEKSKIYTLNDLLLFEEYTIDKPTELTLQERVKNLEEENEKLKLSQFEQDELIIENTFEIANIQLGGL